MNDLGMKGGGVEKLINKVMKSLKIIATEKKKKKRNLTFINPLLS